MSTLSNNENVSDDEIPFVEIPTDEIPIVVIPNIRQDSATTSSTSAKKKTSIYYKYFTFGTDERWHCNYCR
jgi:hypothetical protein